MPGYHFALKAFDAQAIDYLLKSFTDARFHAAKQRAKRLCQGVRADRIALDIERLLASLPTAAVHAKTGLTVDRVVVHVSVA